MFQDSSSSYANANSVTAGGSTTLSGSFYFPTTELDFSGGGGGSTMGIVANVVKFNGGGAFTVNQDTTGNTTGLFTTKAALIE